MRWMGLGLVAVFAIALVSRAAPPAPPAGPTITIQVTDQATGDPIPQAMVSAANERTTTDDYGQATLAVTERGRYFSINVSKEGYVSMGADWRNLKVGDKLPDQLTFTMAPGTSMGGKVVDENGKPVADATVELIAPQTQLSQEGLVRSRFQGRAHTNAEGKWSINSAPADVEMVDYQVRAPGFFFDQVYRQGPSVAEFRDRSAVLTVQHAASISGRVVDSTGKPVAGADVLAGEQGWGGVRHRARTDADGHFTLSNMRPGGTTFAVVTDHFAPQLVQVNLPTTQPAEVRLSPGTMLKIHVADSSGKPLQGVDITLDQWRNASYVEHNMRTNIHGDAVWDGAPPDEILMSFTKRRFGAISDRAITATTQPIQITLGPKTRVTGTVVDAKTGEPIKDFTVTPGLIWQNSDQIYWTTEQWAGDVTNHHNGQFEYAPNQPYPHYALRVQAPGYLPSDSEQFEDDAGELHLTFKMNKGVGVNGVVYDSAHKPVSHATVYLGLARRPLQIDSHGMVIDNSGGQIAPAVTDALGRFGFAPQADAFDLLCAMPDGGYAELDVPALSAKSSSPMPHVMVESAEPTTRPSSYDLTLQPWGSIKGKFMIGSKPGAHMELALGMSSTHPFTGREPQIGMDSKTTTDSDGQFAFDHVPPGPIKVYQLIHLNESSTRYVNPAGVEVKPGETATMKIGGTGRPVIGQFDLPPTFVKGSWIAWSANLREHVQGPGEPPMPLGVRIGSQAAKRKWMAEWIKTDAGKTYFAAEQKAFQNVPMLDVQVKPDGTFRVEDVPAGKYDLDAQFYPSNVMQSGGWNHPLGLARKQIVVPAMPGGRSDAPLDIGKIPVTQPKFPQ